MVCFLRSMTHQEWADGQRLSLPGQQYQAKPLTSKYRLLLRASVGVVNWRSSGIFPVVTFLLSMTAAMMLFMVLGELSGAYDDLLGKSVSQYTWKRECTWWSVSQYTWNPCCNMYIESVYDDLYCSVHYQHLAAITITACQEFIESIELPCAVPIYLVQYVWKSHAWNLY